MLAAAGFLFLFWHHSLRMIRNHSCIIRILLPRQILLNFHLWNVPKILWATFLLDRRDWQWNFWKFQILLVSSTIFFFFLISWWIMMKLVRYLSEISLCRAKWRRNFEKSVQLSLFADVVFPYVKCKKLHFHPQRIFALRTCFQSTVFILFLIALRIQS